ncbi:hypothetical protein C8Q76DRAFT_613165 [Earliella scabrosa]|nr:hypothetical protein C8Q76DRAFT_613165 [Earliella scabrosa]
MHAALLIDEILQLVFDFCADLPKTKPGWTFAQLARCCKAWKDPALDRLWARLDGMEPLLALLPKNSERQLPTHALPASFLANARRVRRITHTRETLSANTFHDLSPILPRLEHVALSFHGCMVHKTWTTSTRLKTINLTVGFSRAAQAVVDRSNAAASFLHQAGLCAPDLHSVQLRGRMSAALNQSVAALTRLQSLTIQSSCYLSPSTFATIATFPHLRVLEVHADHIQADEFEDMLAPESVCFPALQELTIRTGGPLLAAILTRLPVDSLTKLHLDMDKCLRGPAYMKPIFSLLAQKASTSLRELLVEDRTDFEDLEVYPPSQDFPHWYTLDVLSPLAPLKHLRRFVLRDPDFDDATLEQLAKWWPVLEHLDLGTFDPDHSVPKWKAQMTPAAYGVAAKFFARLTSLALPSIPPTSVDPEQSQQRALRCLTVGDVPNASTEGSSMVDALFTIFPSLNTLDCPTIAITDRFDTVVTGTRQ